MTSFYDITKEELIKILKTYNKDCDDSLNDYETIIKRAEINTEWNDVKFTFALGYIILDIDTLEFKEGAPLNNAVTEKVTPIPEERKQTEEYFKQQQEYIKQRGWI